MYQNCVRRFNATPGNTIFFVDDNVEHRGVASEGHGREFMSVTFKRKTERPLENKMKRLRTYDGMENVKTEQERRASSNISNELLALILEMR